MKLFVALTGTLSLLPAVLAKGCGLSIGQDVNAGPNASASLASLKGRKGTRKTVQVSMTPDCGLPSAMEIDLPDGKGTKKFNHVLSSPGGGTNGASSWYGESGTSTFKFVKNAQGAVFGSMVDTDTGDVYQFAADADGNPTVDITPSSELPPEVDPENESPPLPADGKDNYLLRRTAEKPQAIPRQSAPFPKPQSNRELEKVREAVAGDFTAQDQCTTDGDCNDGLYCNGAETWGGNNLCVPVADPCTGENEKCTQKTQKSVRGKCSDVEVFIKTDIFPFETSWVVTDDNGNVVMSGGGYTEPAAEFVETECLVSGMYTFTIYDDFDDGMCCLFGEGGYEVTTGERSVAMGGSFGSSESTPFEVVASSSKSSKSSKSAKSSSSRRL